MGFVRVRVHKYVGRFEQKIRGGGVRVVLSGIRSF